VADWVLLDPEQGESWCGGLGDGFWSKAVNTKMIVAVFDTEAAAKMRAAVLSEVFPNRKIVVVEVACEQKGANERNLSKLPSEGIVPKLGGSTSNPDFQRTLNQDPLGLVMAEGLVWSCFQCGSGLVHESFRPLQQFVCPKSCSVLMLAEQNSLWVCRGCGKPIEIVHCGSGSFRRLEVRCPRHGLLATASIQYQPVGPDKIEPAPSNTVTKEPKKTPNRGYEFL